MNTEIKIHEFPALRDPILIAGWPGMGYVAYAAVKYLKRKFNAKLLAEIDPKEFFHPHEVWVRDGVLDLPELPQNHLYYVRDTKDLVIFLGDAQPPLPKELQLAELVLDLAAKLGVKFIYTFAAMPTHSSHTKKPQVYGAPTHPELLDLLRQHRIPTITGTISGMNGLLLGAAKSRGFKGICLLGEIPYYTVELRNPRSSMAVLEAFCKLEGLELDLSELEDESKAMEAQLERMAAKFREELERYRREPREPPSYIG